MGEMHAFELVDACTEHGSRAVRRGELLHARGRPIVVRGWCASLLTKRKSVEISRGPRNMHLKNNHIGMIEQRNYILTCSKPWMQDPAACDQPRRTRSVKTISLSSEIIARRAS